MADYNGSSRRFNLRGLLSFRNDKLTVNINDYVVLRDSDLVFIVSLCMISTIIITSRVNDCKSSPSAIDIIFGLYKCKQWLNFFCLKLKEICPEMMYKGLWDLTLQRMLQMMNNIIPNQMNKSKKKSTSSIVDIISWWDIQDIYAK